MQTPISLTHNGVTVTIDEAPRESGTLATYTVQISLDRYDRVTDEVAVDTLEFAEHKLDSVIVALRTVRDLFNHR